jgi:HAD superfamily hydrolase (TIGR01458 family)
MAGPVKGLILDVDGVLVYQGQVMVGAVETVQALRDRGLILRFLTNSTLKSRRSCTEKLQRQGFSVDPAEVITASYATAVYLASLKPRSCWLMLDGDGREEFAQFAIDAENPEYVVVGDNRSAFDFEHLNHAVRLLLRGARLIGMQPEQLDGSMGPTELNVGAWVGMLERAAGVAATYVGKPNRYAFDITLRSMGLRASEVLMVGDRPSTDVAGASTVGMRSILVRTGEYDPRELDGVAPPDFGVDSIQDVIDIIDGLKEEVSLM